MKARAYRTVKTEEKIQTKRIILVNNHDDNESNHQANSRWLCAVHNEKKLIYLIVHVLPNLDTQDNFFRSNRISHLT